LRKQAKGAFRQIQQALIDDNVKIYVTDTTPDAEPRYRARFYFDPNGISMSSGNAHYILYALNASNVVVARVEFRYSSGNYQVRAAVVNDSTTWKSTSWTTISNAPHKLEIDWKASSGPGSNNGGITFWVDDVQKGAYTNIDNDTRTVDTVRLGAVDGIDTATRGTYFFDDFVSNRETYIGMAAPGSGKKVLAALKPVENQPEAGSLMPYWTTPQAAEPMAPLSEAISMTITYTYDPLYRLTAADYSDGNYTYYTYDAVGNRLTQETPAGTNDYEYDIANRLTEVDGVSYTWDNNGNLTNDGTRLYSYDRANRLKYVSGGGVLASFGYNGRLNFFYKIEKSVSLRRINSKRIFLLAIRSSIIDRLQQTVNDVTTNYSIDIAAGLTQVLADDGHTYLYGVGRIAQDGPTSTEYFLTDALGSVRQLADADGQVSLAQSYQPYGETLSSSGEGATSYGFVGEWTDSYSGLVNVRARYYAPWQGRFLSRDVWEGDDYVPMSYNGWLYVYANPIN
jgi:RHS repeat-associated protein